MCMYMYGRTLESTLDAPGTSAGVSVEVATGVPTEYSGPGRQVTFGGCASPGYRLKRVKSLVAIHTRRGSKKNDSPAREGESMKIQAAPKNRACDP